MLAYLTIMRSPHLYLGIKFIISDNLIKLDLPKKYCTDNITSYIEIIENDNHKYLRYNVLFCVLKIIYN